VHPADAQLITMVAWLVNRPLLGVMTGGIALITIGDAMLVTSLAVKPSRVAKHLTSEPV
jgi:hypothetical protein